MARLDDARESKATPSKADKNEPSEEKQSFSSDNRHNDVKQIGIDSYTDSKEISNNILTESKAEYQYGEKSEILSKFSEYLFDLFDANCMADFKRIEEFEKLAIKEFRNFNEKEFTHRQYQLHEEFLVLFESLIEGFLQAENYSVDSFYSELQYYLEQHKRKQSQVNNKISSSVNKAESKSSSSDILNLDELDSCGHANEVVDVVNTYLDFKQWSTIMFEQAKNQAKFCSMQEQLWNAMSFDKDLCNPCKKSVQHRLDAC